MNTDPAPQERMSYAKAKIDLWLTWVNKLDLTETEHSFEAHFLFMDIGSIVGELTAICARRYRGLRLQTSPDSVANSERNAEEWAFYSGRIPLVIAALDTLSRYCVDEVSKAALRGDRMQLQAALQPAPTADLGPFVKCVCGHNRVSHQGFELSACTECACASFNHAATNAQNG